MNDAELTTARLHLSAASADLVETMEGAVRHALRAQDMDATLTRSFGEARAWLLGQTGRLTARVEQGAEGAFIELAITDLTRDPRAAQLAGIAADIAIEMDVDAIYWNGLEAPLPRDRFIEAVRGTETVRSTAREYAEAQAQDLAHARHNEAPRTRVSPRKVVTSSATCPRRAHREKQLARLAFEDYQTRYLRKTLTHELPEDEIEEIEISERRSQSAPLRLSAWALSFAAAMLAFPLAFPVMIFNLLRGEDLRVAGLAVAVAGFYAFLSNSGLAPDINLFL